VSRYAGTIFIVAFTPFHNNITRFIFHGHQSKQEINFVAAKKFHSYLRRPAPFDGLIRVQTFGDALRGEYPHVQIFINDVPKLLTRISSFSAIDLDEIQR